MSKTLKILLILFLFLSLIFTFNYVQATSEDDTSTTEENVLDNNQTSDNTTNNEESNNVIKEDANSNKSQLSALGTSEVTSVSKMNNYSEANLELSNILSIILISIGVLLILFAIAILIRLKK